MKIRGKEFATEGRRKGAGGADRQDRLKNSQSDFDKTHGLIAAGMPKMDGFVDGDLQRKILPEIVRPIDRRAIGPRGI